ncbi:MAG TPA: transposase [Acetobacteraceae bacterium]|jgi:transposase|nr:transposase [Acetobacteraceae bacterium]
MDDINADAKGGFRRIEVLTGPTRRRRWSASEKARIVAETLAPGGSVSEVARRWQVCPQQVFTWRREARALALPAEGADLVQASFVPIVSEMADAPPLTKDVQDAVPKTERSGKGAGGSSIEIKLAGAVVRVTPGTDAALLAEVLRAIRASAA